jgi:hypothetical protein
VTDCAQGLRTLCGSFASHFAQETHPPVQHTLGSSCGSVQVAIFDCQTGLPFPRARLKIPFRAGDPPRLSSIPGVECGWLQVAIFDGQTTLPLSRTRRSTVKPFEQCELHGTVTICPELQISVRDSSAGPANCPIPNDARRRLYQSATY